jgi:hypothetical protein
VNGFVVIPLLVFCDIAQAYTILCVLLSALLGWGMHQWALDVMPVKRQLTAFVSGVSLQFSSIVLSAVHNGSSEAMSGCWVVLALWQLWRLVHKDKQNRYLTSIFLFVAFLSSWYSAVITAIFGVAISLSAPKQKRKVVWTTFVLALILTLPMILATLEAASGTANLIRIKDPAVLGQVRRTIGSADPFGYFHIGHRSPDFRFVSRFDETFVHGTYLGLSVFLSALFAFRRAPLWIGLCGLTCFVTSLGPVLVMNAQPLISDAGTVVPLPYSIFESLPGFRHLSLLYRFALGVQISLALLLVYNRLSAVRWSVLLVVVLLEYGVHAHILEIPSASKLPDTAAAEKLKDAPEGGVMLYPHVGARPFLYWQTIHGKPLAASLNFPLNGSAQRLWTLVTENSSVSDERLKQLLREAARKREIRYILIFRDASVMPDVNHEAVERIKVVFGTYASDSDGDVVRLW